MKSETENDTAINYIIYKDLEPGVINNDMLEKMIIEQGYTGEAGRLMRLDPVKFENITVIRIEFQNILKVDHLWVLPNLDALSLKFNKIDKIEGIQMLTKLKKLDLSFNYIDKIENLETLVNLEILSLYNNQITKLENIDSLEKLLILSVGNNKIETYDGIERLRFMKKLYSFNMEGNPIARKPDVRTSFRTYIAAFLPNLKYYNYSHISDAEREKGQKIYSYELLQLEEAQCEEVKERERIAKELADEERLSSSFVELLNEHQLFDSLWVGDADGKILLQIGDEAHVLVQEFREEVYAITQQIYKIGLERHEIRLNEIKMFEECVNEAKIKAQKVGIENVNKFLEKQENIFDKVRQILAKMEKEMETNDEETEEYTALSNQYLALKDEFFILSQQTWQTLMDNELCLYERVEEANTQFGHSIMDLLNEFIEAAQSKFVLIRDAEMNFSEAIMEETSRFITDKAAASDEAGVPEELRECLEDKEIIVNFVAGSRDYHTMIIDAREDKLVTRARNWAKTLVENMQADEIKRNREKVMEINYLLDKYREAFERLQEEKQMPDN